MKSYCFIKDTTKEKQVFTKCETFSSLYDRSIKEVKYFNQEVKSKNDLKLRLELFFYDRHKMKNLLYIEKSNDRKIEIVRLEEILFLENNTVIEIEKRDRSFIKNGVAYCNIVQGMKRENNLIVTVRKDNDGQYLDFSKSRYKNYFSKNKIYLTNEKD